MAILTKQTEVQTLAVETFQIYTLKLNEKAFKPMFLKLTDWGLRSNAGQQQRQLFFTICACLQESLKSIFVPYVGYMMEPIVQSLNAVHSGKAVVDEGYTLSLTILRQCFSDDTVGKTFS